MDTVLGLIELALYVMLILALSAAATFAVVKVSPVGGRKKPAQDETPS